MANLTLKCGAIYKIKIIRILCSFERLAEAGADFKLWILTGFRSRGQKTYCERTTGGRVLVITYRLGTGKLVSGNAISSYHILDKTVSALRQFSFHRWYKMKVLINLKLNNI